MSDVPKIVPPGTRAPHEKSVMVWRGARGKRSSFGPAVGTVGNFDGVHLGHQAILARMEEYATAGRPTVVVSFAPHPVEVLRPGVVIPKISNLRLKALLLAHYGADALALLHFTPELSRWPARRFVEEILLDELDIETLIVGPDARVGANGEGTTETISAIFAERGRRVEVVEFVGAESSRVSSRGIRELLHAGDVRGASRRLGYRFTLEGRVISGAHRGHGIGYPTANLATRDQILPAFGVYAGWCELDGRCETSVMNIGIRPTFGGGAPSVEVHLIDLAGERNLYGTRLRVQLVERIRPELKFADVAALRAQIALDIDRTRAILSADTDRRLFPAMTPPA